MAVNPSIQLGTSGNWAIKEDNLLAYKQLGNKFFDREFDFSRGTTATFVGRNGLIQESFLTGTELVTNGDFATDSDWVESGGATISGGQANIVGDGTSFTNIIQYSIFTIGKKYKVSVDVTISSGLGLKFQDGANNENIGFATTSGTYVFYFTGTSNANFVIGRRTGGTAFNSSVNNVSIKEIQLDVPRIDFTDDPTGHLLLEPQSTNILAYSQDFSQNYWGKKSATVTTSTITDPTGDQNSFKLVPNSGTGGNRSIGKNFLSLSGLHTQSVFAKKGEYSYIALRTRNNPNVSVMFDLENGTFNVNQTSVAFVSAKIEDYGSGWYKCSITVDPSQMSSAGQIFTSFSVGITGNETNSFDGDGTSGVYIFGAQFEQNSFATSYIPTSGSTSTRNQELCNNSGTVNDFNSEEGVLYAEIAALADDLTYREITLSDGTSNNRVELRFRNVSNDIGAVVRSIDGAIQVSLGSNAYTITSFNKIAISYKSNDFNFWINGVKIGTDTSGVTPIGLSELAFDANGSDALPFFGKTKNVKAFKRALTDAELYLLTVTQYQSYQEMATALNYTL